MVTVLFGFFTIVVGCSLAYLRLTAPDDGQDALTPSDWLLLLGPIVLDIIVGVIGFTFLWRRTKAESAAGYTTMTSGYSKLDQVDPKTGVVIRRAGSSVLTEPGREGVADGMSGNPNDLRFTGSGTARSGLIFGGVGAVALVSAVTYGSLSGSDGDVGTALLVIVGFIGFVGVILAISLGGVAAYTRSIVNPVRKARPDALVFLSQRTPELAGAGRDELTVPKSRLIPVSVGADGLELWGKRGAFDPASVIPWSSITRVQPGRLLVTSGNRSFKAATLHVFRMVDGIEQDFPLPIYGANGLGFARPIYANTVLEAVARYARIA